MAQTSSVSRTMAGGNVLDGTGPACKSHKVGLNGHLEDSVANPRSSYCIVEADWYE